MNLIGKIFVVIILVLSVIFMGLAMAVYSTHKNWKAAVDSQNTQIRSLTSEKKQETSKYHLDVSNLRLELDSVSQQIRKLESERDALIARNEEIQTSLSGLTQIHRDATAALKTTQDNNAQLAQENTGLQREIIVAQESADSSFSKTLETTSDLHDTAIKLDSELERNAALTEQVSNMTIVLRRNDINPATRPGDVKPLVNGYVSDIQRRAGSEVIELTIGSDDGLKKGHTLEVFRNNKYLGRAEVLQTTPDRAVARIIPSLKKGRILEGDRVATRLN